jgi:hypothetical protein
LIGIGIFASFQRGQAYETGHAAYLQADCAAAIDPLSEAAGGSSSSQDDEIALKARQELQECEALLAAADLDTQGRPADAVLAYSEFVRPIRAAHSSRPLWQRAKG